MCEHADVRKDDVKKRRVIEYVRGMETSEHRARRRKQMQKMSNTFLVSKQEFFILLYSAPDPAPVPDQACPK